MANVARKYIPLLLIGAAWVASAVSYGRLPAMVQLRLEELLPFATTQPDESAARWFVLTLVPVLALAAWAAFRLAPTTAGQKIGRWMFRRAPEDVTAPAQFERFGKTYDTIVLAVVLLLVGIHASLLAAALQAPGIAARVLSAVLGGSLLLMGNVMPRVRPNWVAGLRSQRLLADPPLWRRAHRLFGSALVLSGLATLVTGFLVPRYGLLVGIASLLLTGVLVLVASLRMSSTVPAQP